MQTFQTVKEVAEFRKDVRRPVIPACPCEGRVAVHVLRVNRRARVEQQLDCLVTSEGGRAVQRGLPFCSAIAHESARLHVLLGDGIRIRAVSEQNLNHEIKHRHVWLAQRRVQRCFHRIAMRVVHVRATLDQEFAQPPVTMKASADQIEIVPKRFERFAIQK